MNSVFILLNSLNDWKPYCETDSLVTVTDYLEHRYGERTPKLVINLSDEYGYNSEGYYCSLLAQARGHRVLPGVETLNKLESGAGIRMNSNLQQLCHQWIERNRITDEIWQLNIYFGTCREKGLEKIARFIFDHYPCPILRVTMNNHIPDGTIRYTLDGSDPVETSTAYTEPVKISDVRVVKARVFGLDGHS